MKFPVDLQLILIIIVSAWAVFGGTWLFLKFRYIRKIRELGWRWVESPNLSATFGLNCDPFGVGYNREIDDLVIGAATTGEEFRAFRYAADRHDDRNYILTMPLPKSLPEFQLVPSGYHSPEIRGVEVPYGHGVAIAADADYGTAVANVLATMPPAPFCSENQQLRMSIDHAHLTLAEVPRKNDQLAAAVEWLADAHRKLLASEAMAFDGPPPPMHLSFCGHSSWVFSPRDDSALGYVEHYPYGMNHRAENIVYAERDTLSFIRLTHHWQTFSGSGKNRRIKNHSEVICEFEMGFPFLDISVNRDSPQEIIKFESAEFNEKFKVRANHPKFAHDVFHPRQLEYLLRYEPVPFEIEGASRVRFDEQSWSIRQLEYASDWLFGFFGRVPDFVWQDLGAYGRPVPEVESYPN